LSSSSSSSGHAKREEHEKNDYKKKAELKRRYAHAASQGMTSYTTLMYENEGGIAPFYSGVLTRAI
jgi:hypothetical protein